MVHKWLCWTQIALGYLCMPVRVGSKYHNTPLTWTFHRDCHAAVSVERRASAPQYFNSIWEPIFRSKSPKFATHGYPCGVFRAADSNKRVKLGHFKDFPRFHVQMSSALIPSKLAEAGLPTYERGSSSCSLSLTTSLRAKRT